ncbi:uncharacterized protein LOC124459329 isoform X2 [Xenia sp. Carnegie-2017]|uniref:uncharacterized protein LOC124459329 isoform X2 n=1 Tax=Xenia sp. Carnegie-2017 TaxID=2897299 RepID=UPI001F04F311|nr:uncharacterized protein LOC124459329 isoform X2 [Xenia sp. Carnegie-2017]
MHNSFVFVHRYPHLLLDGYGWILCCSCDANRKQFVEALPNNIQLDPQKDIPYPSCIHILAIEKYLVVYDRKFGIEAKDFIEKSNENDASDFTDLPEKNGNKILAPSESGICSCGAEWDKRSIQDEWLYVDLCSIAYFYSIHDVKVYCRPCSSCATKKHYDGIENRIVWFGSYAISHAVLKDYIRLFITSSLPMYKYYVAYVQRQVSSGNFNFPKEITYAKFRLAIIAMIRIPPKGGDGWNNSWNTENFLTK